MLDLCAMSFDSSTSSMSITPFIAGEWANVSVTQSGDSMGNWTISKTISDSTSLITFPEPGLSNRIGQEIQYELELHDSGIYRVFIQIVGIETVSPRDARNWYWSIQETETNKIVGISVAFKMYRN